MMDAERIKNSLNAKTAITAMEIAKTELERVIDENEQLRSKLAQTNLELERLKGLVDEFERRGNTISWLAIGTRWLFYGTITALLVYSLYETGVFHR